MDRQLGRPLNSTAFADVNLRLSLRKPVHRKGNLAISTHLLRGSDGKRGSWIILPLIFALASNSAAQDKFAPIQSSSRVGENEKGLIVAEGELVKELDDAIWHVFQASNNDYWFGSRDQGVYRYDGTSLVRFTVRDGLCDNNLGLGGIQEDKSGNIYFNTSKGISVFDGESFTTLEVAGSRSTVTVHQNHCWRWV